jgi:hypothetical protein
MRADDKAARRTLRRHVALVWVIVSMIAVFAFSYAINLIPR